MPAVWAPTTGWSSRLLRSSSAALPHPQRRYMPCWGQPSAPVAIYSTRLLSDLFKPIFPPGSSSSSPTDLDAGPWICSPPTRSNFMLLAYPRGISRQPPSAPPATSKTSTPTGLRARRQDGEWPLWRSRLLCVHLSYYRCYGPPLCVILCEGVKNP